jgi:hypothetical protein
MDDKIRKILDSLKIKKYEVLPADSDTEKSWNIVIYGQLPLAVFAKLTNGLNKLGLKDPKIFGDKGQMNILVSEP